MPGYLSPSKLSGAKGERLSRMSGTEPGEEIYVAENEFRIRNSKNKRDKTNRSSRLTYGDKSETGTRIEGESNHSSGGLGIGWRTGVAQSILELRRRATRSPGAGRD